MPLSDRPTGRRKTRETYLEHKSLQAITESTDYAKVNVSHEEGDIAETYQKVKLRSWHHTRKQSVYMKKENEIYMFISNYHYSDPLAEVAQVL
jgi:hypothetical protein